MRAYYIEQGETYYSTFLLISYTYVTLLWWGKVGFYDVKSVKNAILYQNIVFLPPYLGLIWPIMRAYYIEYG